MRILVVEDEPDLARAVKKTLEEEGYACDWAADGAGALFDATHVPYDAVVLDLMLPKVDGIEVLRRLRSRGITTPVLILTALDTLPEKVRGLDEGADDYLTKPFALEELLARVRALIRRSAAQPSPTIEIGDVRINTSSHRVERDGEAVELTAREYALLELLVFQRGALVTRTAIYDHLYDDESETLSNVVEVYVARLRRKLGHDLIQTRRGEGYMIP